MQQPRRNTPGVHAPRERIRLSGEGETVQGTDENDGQVPGPMKINPITVEVVRNAINAYADEMATALCKSAYNMMIYEVRDFCCGLIDGEGRMISQNKGGLPIFLADLGIAVKDGIDRYGLDGFAPGA